MNADGLHTDCALYRGSMPCEPHKRDGRPCAGCDEYALRIACVLIVKLGAMGDVLRTTALLDDLAARHPGVPLVWLTKPESTGLLCGHPALDRVIATDEIDALDAIPFSDVYAFDSDPTPGAVNDNYEGHGMERSRRLPGGPNGTTYRIRVQYAVTNANIPFRLDDWHLAVITNQ